MPITYAILPNSPMEVRLLGRVTADDFLEFFQASARDPGYKHGMDRLILADAAKDFPTGDEIRGIAIRVRDRMADSRGRFAVVTQDPLVIGIANMLFTSSDLPDRYQIFASRRAAEMWLNSG